MTDFSHVDGAEENEVVVEYLDESEGAHRNWIVTIHFYSLLHYTEQRLEDEGYNPQTHRDRKDDIKDCRSVDSGVYKKYRKLETLSQNSRYECVRMDAEDIEESRETLEEGKSLLGFDQGGSGNHKYST